MAIRNTNIRVILNRLLRNPLLSDLTLETVLTYTIDFFQIMGIPNNFEEKVETLRVKNYRTPLPINLYEINQIRNKDGYMRESNASFKLSQKKYENIDSIKKNEFFVESNYIYFNFEKGEIEISYQSISVDEEGLPTLPDNANFLRALEIYIKKQRYDILYDSGKISDKVLNKVEQDYAWVVGSLETDSQKLSLSKAENLFKKYSTLIPKTNEFNTGFN